MTQIVQAGLAALAGEAETASRDLQRESLEQIVRLSMECSAEEQRIEQEHAAAKEGADTELQAKIRAARHRFQQRMTELTASTGLEQKNIRATYDSARQALESETQSTRQQLTRQREGAEAALKKQLEESSWQSESLLVAFEMRLDTEEQKAQETLDANVAELGALKVSVREAMVRYRLAPFAAEPTVDEAMKLRLASEPAKVLEEHRQLAVTLLKELQRLTQGGVMDDVVPVSLIVVIAGVVAGWAWIKLPEGPSKAMTTGGLAAGAAVLGIGAWLLLRFRKRARVKAQANLVYERLMQSVGLANQAARADFDNAEVVRDRRVREARRKRDQELAAARDQGRSVHAKSADHYRAALAAEAQRYKDQLAVMEDAKARGLEELERSRESTAREIEQEDSQVRAEAQAVHASAESEIEARYASESAALAARWEDGLKKVSELLAVGSGIDPKLVDWNSAAWEKWKAPTEFSGQVRFGDMKVDLGQLTEHVPKRLTLPESFSVPAMLSFPDHASLLVDSDHSGRAASNELAQMVMARLLTQMPAGRVKFTIFDPVGLGQSFAGFMHLADHDESLVGSRIWTEKDHMQQRLTDLTEHMETVIQKYLRNEYATIDEYNAQAGELAEPSRFLVIADFPTGFEPESLRRLASIAITGPRCGVYTLILRDVRQSIPAGSRMEDIVSRSVHLVHKNGGFTWDDAVFKRFPLRIDPPPDEKTLTRLMDQVGKAAKEAKRVEVPFQSIAPAAPENGKGRGQFWSMSSKNDLKVPIGKSGATRLQSLRLGIGVAQHVLVAGKTGSGKSNLMHTIVTNMAMWYGPDEVEFYLVDFKKGVEFKAYASSELPHARAIAVESDREFGLSVLQRVDAEMTRRGVLFRESGAQEIGAYRDKTGQKLPRTVLLIDEFQEFFSEDDKLGQEASGLLDRLVRQGRAFGVHVVLGSQTIGGSSGLARSTLGQIAVRVALQCTEADSQMILGDNNSAARLLTRPGEAIYNDAGGLVEANSPFQIAFLPDDQREKYLQRVHVLAQGAGVEVPTPIVFEGNSAAEIRKNRPLVELLERADYPAAASSVLAYVGEPVAIKEPSAITMRRQSGANVLLVGQQEESAVGIFASLAASIAAQHKPGEAVFYLLDGSPADSRYFGVLERVMAALPHETKVVGIKDVGEAINELATRMAERQGNDAHAGPAIYLLLFGLQRYRLLRKQEDDFSFNRGDAPAAKPDKQLAELLSEGPALGLHQVIWADSPITLERTLDRGSMRQFDHRILFQMSAADSSNLIDSPLANRLGAHRALLYSEEQGTVEKFRPYEVPDEAWLNFVAERLKARPS